MSSQWKISMSNGTSEKVVLFSRRKVPNGNFCSIDLIKPIFDTSSRLSRPFFGKRNSTDFICGKHDFGIKFTSPGLSCSKHG